MVVTPHGMAGTGLSSGGLESHYWPRFVFSTDVIPELKLNRFSRPKAEAALIRVII
jgi:hypothetical protein